MTADQIVLLTTHLQADEGLRLHPYVDTVGKLTIGYGRNLTDDGISLEEAALLLTHDIDRHVGDLFRTDPFVARLDAVRQIVLAEMVVNLGIGRLRGFVQMWARLHAGDYAGAAREMRRSTWAQQVGARADRLAAAMATGGFPT
jgi:lysozyme